MGSSISNWEGSDFGTQACDFRDRRTRVLLFFTLGISEWSDLRGGLTTTLVGGSGVVLVSRNENFEVRRGRAVVDEVEDFDPTAGD